MFPTIRRMFPTIRLERGRTATRTDGSCATDGGWSGIRGGSCVTSGGWSLVEGGHQRATRPRDPGVGVADDREQLDKMLASSVAVVTAGTADELEQPSERIVD